MPRPPAAWWPTVLPAALLLTLLRPPAAPAVVAVERLAGTALVLTAKPRRTATVRAGDPTTTLGGGPGSAEDPTRVGGTLRLRSFTGDTIVATVAIPARRWRPIGPRTRPRGWKARGIPPLERVVLEAGKGLAARASGSLLPAHLQRDPAPLDVSLTIGERSWCARYGGTTTFEAGVRFTARDAPPSAACGLNLAPWRMHPIASRWRGANGLGPGDVDQDGFQDYVTNYEFDQRYVLSFHPGTGTNPRLPWEQVEVFRPTPFESGYGVNPENSTLGDFDGDGNLDVAAAQGFSFVTFWEGSQPGVRLLWGPAPERVRDPAAWTDAGRIPDTVETGHFLTVLPLDVNGDGRTDIVAGGRVHAGNGIRTGIVWIEAPPAPADPRDLSLWRMWRIDPDQYDGHGVVFVDMDDDGDPDFVDANADWDTPEDEETVHWYENPGPGNPAQRGPWTKHLLHQGPEYFAKPQIAAGDIDRDGDIDVLTMVRDAVYWFRKDGPARFERVVIPKHPTTVQLSRPLRVADLDGDGWPDLLGMLLHDSGTLPADKAAVFWMQSTGAPGAADGWLTHSVKWGSGRTMRLGDLPDQRGFGEKWDGVELDDVDRDGDLDVVANCEEWWQNANEVAPFWDPGDPSSVAVVWFENHLREDPPRFGEQRGVVAIEAEHATNTRDNTWIERATFPGFSGEGYVQDHRSLTAEETPWETTRGLDYAIEVRGGRYHVWVRRWIPAAWGAELGGSRSDSAWIGVDGRALPAPLDDLGGVPGAWEWVATPEPLRLARGAHVLSLRVREGGYAIDRILLARSARFTPTGVGPDATRLP